MPSPSIKFGEKTDLTYYCLKFFWYIGIHPEQNSKILTLLYLSVITCYQIYTVLGVAGAWFSLSEDIFYAIECLQTSTLTIHLTIKYSVVFYNKSLIANLIKSNQKFFKLPPQYSEISNKARKWIVFYYFWTASGISCFLAQPLLGNLPIVAYVPEGWFSFLVLIWYSTQPVSYCSCFGLNTLIWALCINMYLQFKVLGQKFYNLQFKTSKSNRIWDEIKQLVEHHNFLLRYCSEINKLASTVYLFTFFNSTLAGCVALFIVTQAELTPVNFMKNMFITITQLADSFAFCLSADLASEAAAGIASNVYESKWYDAEFCNIKSRLGIVMAQARRPIIFSGYGLININLQTFTLIFKSCLSYYTYLNTMVTK